jgi:hypothetical protein
MPSGMLCPTGPLFCSGAAGGGGGSGNGNGSSSDDDDDDDDDGDGDNDDDSDCDSDSDDEDLDRALYYAYDLTKVRRLLTAGADPNGYTAWVRICAPAPSHPPAAWTAAACCRLTHMSHTTVHITGWLHRPHQLQRR